MDCVFYWQNNSWHLQQDVKLKNSKYCQLYPKYINMTKKQLQKSEHCKSLYTKCDYYLEQWIHVCILKLEKLLKDHQKLVKHEVEIQKELINDMWIQSQKYLLLTSGVCVKPFPEIVSQPTEKRALCRFHISLRKVNESNCLLALSMENIQSHQTELNRRCGQLDMTVESPFINGTYSLKSLFYVRNILNDLFHCFYSNICKQQCWAQLLDPADSVSIEDYMNLIKSNKECDLMENRNNCSCSRSKRKECSKYYKAY